MRAAVALVIVLIGATAAHAAEPLVIDESIGPVRLGMTPDEVRAAIGEPDQVLPSDLHAGWHRWTYRDRSLTLTIADGREVWDVRTRSDRYRSRRGLRVGLREATVKRRLPRALCVRYGKRRQRMACTNGRVTPSEPFTQVGLYRGIAREVRVAQGLAY